MNALGDATANPAYDRLPIGTLFSFPFFNTSDSFGGGAGNPVVQPI